MELRFRSCSSRRGAEARSGGWQNGHSAEARTIVLLPDLPICGIALSAEPADLTSVLLCAPAPLRASSSSPILAEDEGRRNCQSEAGAGSSVPLRPLALASRWADLASLCPASPAGSRLRHSVYERVYRFAGDVYVLLGYPANRDTRTDDAQASGPMGTRGRPASGFSAPPQVGVRT